jgi:hypothetical protein
MEGADDLPVEEAFAFDIVKSNKRFVDTTEITELPRATLRRDHENSIVGYYC